MPIGRSRRGPLLALVVALGLTLGCSTSGDPVERAADASTSTDLPASASETTSTAGDSTTPPEPDADAPTLRIGLAGIDSFDPVAASPAAVAQIVLADLLYDTLAVIDDAGVAQPSLASFSANADQTVWRFELDQGATFADGSAVTADDVAFSLERVLAGGRGSLPAIRLERVAGISISGTSTVDIALTEPSAVLPELLASPLYAVTARDAIERASGGGDPTPNASGDYVATFDGGDQVLLERRSGEGPAQIQVDFFDDEDAALDAFLDGAVDWTVAPADRVGEASDLAGAAGLVPFHGGLMLGVDSAVAPLDDAGLRRAIALAIDRQAVVDTVFGPTAQPARGVIPAGVTGGVGDACRGVCGPSRGEAEDLVAAALPDGQTQPIRLLVDDSDSMQGVAGVLERQLTAVGLEIEVVSLPVETYEGLIATGQQQLFVYGWLGVARSPSSLLPALFDSASPDNVSGLADANVDAALRAARVEPIASVRAAAWRDVEVAILEQVPVVPLLQFRTTGVVSPRVSGFVVRADGSVDLDEVTIDA